MSLLEVKDLFVSFGDKVLLKNGNFDLYKGEHVGLVGDNGVGKSTLMKILLNKILPDTGSIVWQNNIKIGYIDQHLKSEGDITVYEYLKSAFSYEFDLELELNKLYEKLAEDYDESLMKKIGNIQDELERNDFYSIQSKIDKTIIGLGIDSFGVDTFLTNLSGGQQSKVILARLLLENSNVLLLDEPTNFLDYKHILWLIDYLKAFEGTFVVISHDLEFLNEISNCILDIEFLNIRKYHANYKQFLNLKAEYKANYLKDYSKQQDYIQKTEAFIRKNKAGVNSKIARGRQKQLDRVERLDKPGTKVNPTFYFKTNVYKAELEVKSLGVGYDSPLFPSLNMKVRNGEKIAISGFNGVGKSTLLKTIIGELDPISGHISHSKDVTIGYYEQELNWDNEDLNALEIVSEHYPNLKLEVIRRELSTCGISAENLTQPVSKLSGGEQSKVKLCILILRKANVLILDEPTNHLDKDTKDHLKKAIEHFDGTVILVSHEKNFYNSFVDRVYEIKA